MKVCDSQRCQFPGLKLSSRCKHSREKKQFTSRSSDGAQLHAKVFSFYSLFGVERRSARQFFERTRKSQRQSDEHWNCFKGNFAEASQRRGVASNYGIFRYHLELY